MRETGRTWVVALGLVSVGGCGMGTAMTEDLGTEELPAAAPGPSQDAGPSTSSPDAGSIVRDAGQPAGDAGRLPAPDSGQPALDAGQPKPLGCADCHGAPPDTGDHLHHFNFGWASCSDCHPGTNAAGTALVDPAPHENGIDEVTFPEGGTWNASQWTCTVACHTRLGVPNPKSW